MDDWAEIRTSVEALLTGINGRYQNTQDAPNSDEYDALRKLGSDELKTVFEPFYSELLTGISLTDDGTKIPLSDGIVMYHHRAIPKYRGPA